MTEGGRIGVMDVARCRDISCTQRTQANICTAHTGTQCALRAFTSAGSQTDCPGTEVDTLYPGVSSEIGGKLTPSQVGEDENAVTVTSQCAHCCFCGPSDTGITATDHDSTQLEGNVNACKSCHQRNHPETDWMIHGGTQDRKNPYICSTRKNGLLAHMQVHSGDEPSTDQLHFEGSTRTGILAPHESLCASRRSFVNNKEEFLCSQERLTTKRSLVVRKRLHVGENGYACSLCPQSFAKNAALIIHKRVHTGEKPHVCTVCHKRFAQKGNLRKHERLHSGEKPYTCGTCQKGFTQRGNLINHERVHTGEKPYVCSVCQKCFAQKASLFKHESLHTGERPYACSICQKRFNRKESLNYHETVHSGEKPYICNVCQQRFRVKASLVNHERLHTGEEPYACTLCPNRFITKAQLRAHQRAHTGENPSAIPARNAPTKTQAQSAMRTCTGTETATSAVLDRSGVLGDRP